MNEEKRIENIPIEKIIPNIYQPRIKFDNKSIEELSNSITNHGIIQPLILRKIGDKYEIVDGERRYKAAKKAELKTLPSIIVDISEEEAAELILTENMQKQILTPIEEANAYQQIMLLNNFDIEDLSTKLGKDKITIENKLKLLTLHPEIQEALLNNKISEGHAKSLTKVDSRTKQLDLFHKILKERIPVKALEEMIQETKKSSEEKNPFKEEIEKKNNMEVEFMDNSQLNFNQYNNLLKEQEIPQMEASATPESIMGNTNEMPKAKDFFPSLEEQPLNMEVPMNGQETVPAMEVPKFVTEEQSVQAPVEAAPAMEMPPMAGVMDLPQFEVPAPNMPTPEVAPVPAPVEAAPAMEMPPMSGVMDLPQFEVPAPSMPTPEVAPVPAPVEAAPAMEMPQMSGVMDLPQFEVPAPSMPTPEVAPVQALVEAAPAMEMPPMSGTMDLPQFEVPAPSMPTPEVAPVQAPVEVPAVNMIKSLMELLKNGGYNINIEETDSSSEYQVVIKVQK